jgi:hypothetical protein
MIAPMNPLASSVFFVRSLAHGSKHLLQSKAAKYREYGRFVIDPEIAQSIFELASELEQRAVQPEEEDIRTRAYDLWRKAGEPEDRNEEFWLLY